MSDTRYETQGRMRDLAAAYDGEIGKMLADSLSPDDHELVPLHGTSLRGLLPTYEVRLRRFEDGEGPRVLGLREFVSRLATDDHGSAEMFSWHDEAWNYIGLVRGPALLTVTAVERRTFPAEDS